MERVLEESVRGFPIKLRIRPGVFAQKGLDTGTRLLLDKLVVEDGTEIADLGAGAGVIGIVCAKLDPHGTVDLLEDHLRSANLARENLALNGVANATVYLSDLFSAVPEKNYDSIITNPPQQLGNEFLEELIVAGYTHLRPRGQLWMVVKSNISPVIKRFLDRQGARYDIVARSKEYALFRADK
jgi:16S rRNA (guanine1207-N2)-methyltransferase